MLSRFRQRSMSIPGQVVLIVVATSLLMACASGDRPLEFAGDSPHQQIEISVTGYVTVRYDVGDDGVVRNAEVVESQPDDRYVDHALSIVTGWRFQPARRANVAIVSRGVVSRLTFTVEESGASSP